MTEATFPLRLGAPFATAVDLFGAPEFDREEAAASSCEADVAALTGNWRQAKFSFMRPVNQGLIRAKSVDIFVGYQRSSGSVWSIALSDAASDHSCSLEGVGTRKGVAGAIAVLGPPLLRRPHRHAQLLDVCWWLQGPLAYRLEVFREDYDDLAHCWNVGDIHRLRVFSTEFAPPWDEDVTRIQAGA